MRVSSLQYFQGSVGRLNDLQAQLVQIQQKISSGVEVAKPSDDPARLFEGLQAQKAIDKAEQFNRNIAFAGTQLEQFDNVMGRANDTLIETKRLLVQAGNGTLNQDNRNSLATALRALRDDMAATVNRQDLQGRYLFSGKAEDQPAFDTTFGAAVINPSIEEPSSIEAGQDIFVQLGISANSAFLLSPAGVVNGIAEPEKNVLSIMDSAIQNLESGIDTGSDQDELDALFDKLQSARATVGIRLSSLEANESLNAADAVSLAALKSAAIDTDMAKAISQLVQGQTQSQAFSQTYASTSKLSLFNFVA